MGTLTEVWKDVKGFEQYYQISNFGNIRSKGRTVRCGNGFLFRPGKLLRPRPNSVGYLRIDLKSNGNTKHVFIHRLVAKHFVPNPDGLDTVNHKDFNPKNNSAENLEWTTRNGNYQYSFKKGRFNRTPKWRSNLKNALDKVMGKPVTGTEIKTGHKIKLNALNDCKKYGFQPSCVCHCCQGKRKSHKGFMWEYATRKNTPEELARMKSEWNQ